MACEWEAVDVQNEAEYREAVASWGDLLVDGVFEENVWYQMVGLSAMGLMDVDRWMRGRPQCRGVSLERDWRGEDAGESDPGLEDLEEGYSMMECAIGIASRMDEDAVEVVEGTVVAQALTGGQAGGDVGNEGSKWLVSGCHRGAVEPVTVNSLDLNPQAAEFHPRPRAPMRYCPEVPRSIQLHALVKSSGLPNFRGCRVPASTAINVAAVRDLAKGFHDQEAIDSLSLASLSASRVGFSKLCFQVITRVPGSSPRPLRNTSRENVNWGPRWGHLTATHWVTAR